MSEDEEDSPLLDLDALNAVVTSPIGRYEAAARKLFQVVEKRFGRKEALRVFSLYTKPDRPTPKHQLKKREVLELYYSMTPWRSILGLARDLAEKNKTLPPGERFGKGSTDMHTMRTYISRALKENMRKSPNLHLLLYGMPGGAKPKPKPK